MPKIRTEPQAKPPSLNTLKSYGLTETEWRSICIRQNWTCPICCKPFADRPLVIDHDHVKGFKARKRRKGKKKIAGKRVEIRVRIMSPSERRIHVRGVLHSFCNRFVRTWLTIERASSILEYLKAHEKRKPKPGLFG